MKKLIIHHVNEDFTEEIIETVIFKFGCIFSITFSNPQKL
jgi:hypothetical protein